MVSGHAVVRLPVSSLIALVVVACVFQFLYRTVMQPHPVTVTTIKPIEFTPLLIEHPPVIKSLLPPPPPKHLHSPALPSIGIPLQPQIGPSVIPRTDGTVGPLPTTAPGRVSGVAQPLVRVDPEYPNRALHSGIEGWVQLQFTVGANGSTTDVTVVDSDPRGVFDAAAVRAVQHWKYAPKVDDGRPVEMRGMQVIMRFDLKSAR